MRALSILFVVINIYWYCFQQIVAWRINIGVVDNIFLNFDRTAGLFRSILCTKLFAIVFLAFRASAQKESKRKKSPGERLSVSLSVGVVLFFFNWWLLYLPLPLEANAGFYILTMFAGYICLLMGGVWMSCLLKTT